MEHGKIPFAIDDYLCCLGMLAPLVILSNAPFHWLVETVRREEVMFDGILSSDLLHKCKPDTSIYLDACRLMNVAVEEVMMVAAHRFDTDAAKSVGMYGWHLGDKTKEVCCGNWQELLEYVGAKE